MSILIAVCFMTVAGSLAQILAGQYELWDYYESYLHDYSGNGRHGEVFYSVSLPVLTDRGLYISDECVLKYARNTYAQFPVSCSDMLVSILFNPKTDKKFCMIKLKTTTKSLDVCLESILGNLRIGIEGSWNYQVTNTKAFNIWRLYTIRFSQVSSNTFLYVYLDGESTNPALTFMISSFSFASFDTSWEVGSSTMEGFLYQIWWHCQVTISISTLSSSMINPATSPCTTIYAVTPFKRCLSNELDKYKNSENEDCSSCISNNKSCDKDQICIDSCQYKCINPPVCRSVSYPICSTPAPYYCSSIPGTDICYACNIGWIMSITTPGVCENTVPGCKVFNTVWLCSECLPGYYKTLTSPPACIICPDDCEICVMNSLGKVFCSKCPTNYFMHTSPLCVAVCPLTFYGNTISNPYRCSVCPINCNKCSFVASYKGTVCFECTESFYLQPRFVYSFEQCLSACPAGYFPDNATTLCKPCRSNCEVCTNDSDCSQCNLGYMLSPDNSLCELCLLGCRTCISKTECAVCGDRFWLNTVSKSCNNCSPYCLNCSNSSHCDKCDKDFDEVVIYGTRTCRYGCNIGNYIGGYYKSCVQYSADRQTVDLCSEISSIQVSCGNCLTSELYQNNCPAIICPDYCRYCSTLNGILTCFQCRPTTLLQPDKLSCKTTCPDFYFLNSHSRICMPCIKPNCKVCQSNINACDECGNGNSLNIDSTACVLNCPVTQFTDKSGIWKCKSCITNCEICTNTNDCQRCSSSLFVATTSGVVSCTIACPPRSYFDSNRVCYYCMDNCDVCSKDSNGVLVCSTCSMGFILINKECVELKCDPNCANCVMSSTLLKCELCKDFYFIDPYGYECLATCPERYYADTGSKRCVACMSNCEKCIEARTSNPTCTLCSDSYIFKLSHDLKLCEYATCPDSCTDCIITSPGIICNRCNIGYFMQPSIPKCENTCPYGYYKDTFDNTCKTCSNNCVKCDMSICMRCSSSYYIQPITYDCKSSCPHGYYPDDSTEDPRCSPCQENCKICSDDTKCMECIEGFYIQPFGEKYCDIKCPAEFYPSQIAPFRCDPCIDGCLECDDENICHTCKPGYYMHDRVCFIFCPEYFYEDELDGIKICSACSIGCIKCNNEDYCIECDVNYVLFENACRECDIEDCYHCEALDSTIKCLECMEGYYRMDNMSACVSSCPDDYFIKDEDSCFKCIENCSECPGFYGCISCLEGYYYDPELEDCLTIPINKCFVGIKVEGEFVCTECEEDYYLIESYEESCVTQCPESYYPDNTDEIPTCYRCKENCKSCKSYEICELCEDGAEQTGTCSTYTAEEIAQAKTVKETTSNLSTVSSAASICSGTVSYNYNNAWSMMNTVQIFSYLSVVQVNMSKMMRDAINSQGESKLIPYTYREGLKVRTQPDNHAQKERFENTSFLWNCYKEILQLGVIISIHSLLKLASLALKGNLKAKVDKVLKMFIWKIYARYLVIAYFDILNAACLQIIYVRNI